MRRSRKRKKRFVKQIVTVIIAGIMIVLTVKACSRKRDIPVEEKETEAISIVNTVEKPKYPHFTHDVPKIWDIEYPFNLMSADWGTDDLEGWWHYDLPKEYKAVGSEFPDIIQVYTYCLCNQYNVSYPMVLALIETASGYQWNAGIEDAGIGYMQIVYQYHADVMQGMKEEALWNPYINIRTGIQILSGIQKTYKSEAELLTVYYMGASRAASYWFNDYEHTSPYAESVMEAEKRIRKSLEERERTANAE